jgi:hypothetical protein
MDATSDNPSLRSAVAFNLRLDSKLREHGIVGQALFLQFLSVEQDPNASSVGWLTAKLSVLASRISGGKTLQVFEPSVGNIVPLTHLHELVAWADKHFPVVEFRP